LIVGLITTLLTKKGAKTSTATALAAGALAGVGSYYAGQAYFGTKPDMPAVTGSDVPAFSTLPIVAEDGSVSNVFGPTSNPPMVVQSTFGGVVSSAVGSLGMLLQSWGPTGTLGVVAGVTAAANGSLGTATKTLATYTPLILVGVGLYFLTR